MELPPRGVRIRRNGRRAADSWRLSFLADAGGRQAKAAAVDLVGHGTFLYRLSDRLIQALQEFSKGLAASAHEAHEQRLIVDSNCRSLNRRHVSECDMPFRAIQECADVRPAILVLRVHHGAVSSSSVSLRRRLGLSRRP